MALKVEGDKFILLLNPLRTTYTETCTVENVTYNWLGLNKLVYHDRMGTFTDFEKGRIERQKTEPPESK